MTYVAILLGAWAAWCVLNTLAWLAAPLLAKSIDGAFTNGVDIVIPKSVRARLTVQEIAAVAAHEQGHIVHRHAQRNLLRSFMFLRRDAQRALRDELEADDYAIEHGHGEALATAISKLSAAPLTKYRTRRMRRGA